MSDVIIARPNGEELRTMLFSEYDFEIGDLENSFLVTCPRSEWETVPDGARVYIPGTEYGGIYKRLETSTKHGTVAVGGFTWRGMMQNKVICPESGNAYATDSGELNAIIKERVEAAFPGLFTGSTDSTGIYVSYQYERYTSLYDGLKALLKSVDYKLQISYDQEQCAVIAEAVPIVDYSMEIEYSSDMNANYSMILDKGAINHLICLGSGELAERSVIDLYMDGNGVISQTQTYFGADEIAAVYDYAGASDSDLIQSGRDHLKDASVLNQFSIDLESTKDVDIGDIVGSRDYVTGKSMTAPITTKIIKWRNGFESTEYKLSDDITIEETQTASLMSASPLLLGSVENETEESET